MNSVRSPIAVTGATGYVASWIVQKLLARGDTVHATVRAPDNKDSVAHLLADAATAPGVLKLFRADLLDPSSFDAAFEGCSAVIHTASPFFIRGFKDAERELIAPALRGTENVLHAVSRQQTVQRVVLTSSIAAMYSNAVDAAAAGTLDESVWNEASTLSDNPYSYSKTLAERRAWEICGAQSRWTMATINPGFVLGPSRSKRVDSTSIAFVRAMCRGDYRFGTARIYTAVVDVRDVADAHLKALEHGEGRHLLVHSVLDYLEIARLLEAQASGRFKLPRSYAPKPLLYVLGPIQAGFSWKYLRENVGIAFAVDNSKSIASLGIQYTDISKTLLDHANQLAADGQL